MNAKRGADPEVARRLLDNLRSKTRHKARVDAQWEEAIQEASTAGNSLRDVAEAAGLTHQAIANRLNKGEK